MKALVLHAVRDLRVDDVPKPKPGPGQVLVRVPMVVPTVRIRGVQFTGTTEF
jgi:hypothetical protein